MNGVDDIARLFPDDRKSGATTLRQCQLVMARMLKILDHLCRRHGIRYWMTSGTLIGAIRHKGFIPWDCDVDVGMPRDDIVRLKRVRHEFPRDIFFQDEETDPCFPAGGLVVKLRDRYSNYVEWQRNNPGIRWHNGLQVDMLIYDTDEMGLLVNPYRGTKYRTQDILPTVRLEFEGARLCAPKHYDRYIRKRYPDYLVLPDPEDQVAHEGRADPFSPCDHPESLCFEPV